MSAGERPAAHLAAYWEHFEHDADIGVRGIAPEMAGAFEQAALALTAITTDPEAIEPREAVDIACEAPDAGMLLVDWLNALIYEAATRRCLFGRFEVAIEGTTLRGRAWGEAVDAARHLPAVEAKGATYTALRVCADGDGRWRAECVVDV